MGKEFEKEFFKKKRKKKKEIPKETQHFASTNSEPSIQKEREKENYVHEFEC